MLNQYRRESKEDENEYQGIDYMVESLNEYKRVSIEDINEYQRKV